MVFQPLPYYRIPSLLLTLLAATTPCPQLQAQRATAGITLVDRSEASGLDFRHEDGSSGKEYLVEFMGAGIAVFDYDADGWLDIYFLNGAALQGTVLRSPPTNRLYRNNGDGTFADVSRQAGVDDPGYGLGVAVADYDNDGYQDLYVSNYGANAFFRNNGDGTFANLTDELDLADGTQFGAGVAFLDIDNDGDLDLYSASYVDFSYAKHAQLAPLAYPYPPVPSDYEPLADTLYRNEGDGTFTDVSVVSRIGIEAGPSMGMICGDFDADHDTDIYVACDGAPSLFFVNDGRGVFTESGVIQGLAFDAMGMANGMMGPEAGDVNNDGLDDLFVTNYSGQLAVLFRNLGEFGFEDVSRTSTAGKDVMPHTNWGSGLVDFDNDGDRDLFISNGHMLKRVRNVEQFTDFRVRNCLMANDGRGKYANVSDSSGSGLGIVQSSRGTGFDDLDNDGDIDCVILNCCDTPSYLDNQTDNDNHFLQLRLIGTRMNRDAVGARVRVVTDGLTQVAEVRSGRGYQSHCGTYLHFGLGSRTSIERVEVFWATSPPEVFDDVAVDRRVVLLQGQ
jgi:hypothetical protein